MSATPELQKLAKQVLLPWKSQKVKPPFSPVELLTLALGSTSKDLTEREILRWIKVNFHYYRLLEKRSSMDPERLAFSSLDEGFQAYKAPTQKDQGGSSGDVVWKISPDEARVYLQQRYGYKPSGAFRFLDLPSESRAVIYDMVFQYPTSGLWFIHRDYPFQIMTKDLKMPFSFAKWTKQITWPHPGPYTQSMGEALKLLLVNKQIFDEASPSFYRLNLFYCDSTCRAYNFLQKLPSYRRQQITQFAFEYGPYDTEYASRLFDYLASLPNLQRL